MKTNLAIVALVSLLLISGPLLAQSKGSLPPADKLNESASAKGGSNPVVSNSTLDEFQRRVQALGFQCQRDSTDGKPNDYFTFRAEGRKVAAKAPTPKLLELFVYYTDGASLATVNDWNNSHFASTAFVDKDGNAVLENLLVLTGGVTEENINAFITNFRDSAVDYARFVIDHVKDADKKPAQ